MCPCTTLKGFHCTNRTDLEASLQVVTSAVKTCIWKILMAWGVSFHKNRVNLCPTDKLDFKWIASNHAWSSHMNIIKRYWLYVPNIEVH